MGAVNEKQAVRAVMRELAAKNAQLIREMRAEENTDMAKRTGYTTPLFPQIKSEHGRRGKNQYRSYEELGVTDAQLKYIAEHYGERPLVLLADECGLPRENADMVKKRLQRAGAIGQGPGQNWRTVMQARSGYVPPPQPIRKPIVLPEAVEVKGDPLCTHHRDCKPIERGLEKQVCRLCGDVRVVRIY